MIRNRFDHADFLANPKKYEQVRTAAIAAHIFTENGADDLEQGQRVAVQFMRRAYNGLRRRDEPVYSITTGGKVWGVMFASTLADFVL